MTNETPWYMVLGSVLPSLGVAAWTLIQFMAKRNDDREKSERELEDKRQDNIDRERKDITDMHAKLLVEMNTDLDKYRGLLREKNVERFRAWDLAHFWHSKAWDMRGELLEARQIAESMARLNGQPPPVWRSVPIMPPFEVEAGKATQSN